MEFNINLKYEDGKLTVDYNDGSKTETYPITDRDVLPEKIKAIIQDEVDEYERIENMLSTADNAGFGCVECGTPINPGDKYASCPDCGGVFCAKCAHDGTFENHTCDDGDPEAED